MFLDSAQLDADASDLTGVYRFTMTPFQWLMLVEILHFATERFRWLEDGQAITDTTWDTVEAAVTDCLDKAMSAENL